MAVFARPLSSSRRPLPSFSAGHHHRAVLLGMASVLLLSGCMLSPLFQAPAALMTGVAVLLGLAACSAGGGGGGGGGTTDDGGGGGGDGGGAPFVVQLDALLLGQPANGVMFKGTSVGAGNVYYDAAGFSLAVGDVKGDGGFDLVIGAPMSTHATAVEGEKGNYYTYSVNAGTAYVVFGDSSLRSAWDGSQPAALSALDGGNGFAVKTASEYAYLGASVAVAANLRGNGAPALLLGAPGVANNTGATGVVFTPSQVPAAISVDALSGGDGFLIVNNYQDTYAWDGQYEASHSPTYIYNRMGLAVLGVNLNGDGGGLTDIVTGVPYFSSAYDCVGGISSISSGVFYCLGTGQTRYFNAGVLLTAGDAGLGPSSFVDLDTGTPTFAAADGYFAGSALAKGRVNGDGVDDLIIGGTTQLVEYSPGAVHVVFGTGGTLPASPAALTGANGFTIVTSDYYSYLLGQHVASADVNGDGIGDIITSDLVYGHVTFLGTPNVPVLSGRVWVVFGQNGGPSTPEVDLNNLPASQGFSITLPPFGIVSALATGKINGDGIADVIIGSRDSMRMTQSGAETFYPRLNGAVFVVFGGSQPANVNSSGLTGANGLTVFGPDFGRVGGAVAAADLDGDGFDDLVIGAPNGSLAEYYSSSAPQGIGIAPAALGPNGSISQYHGPGMVYVVFGLAGGANWSGGALSSGDSILGFPILGGPATGNAQAPMFQAAGRTAQAAQRMLRRPRGAAGKPAP